MSNSKALVPYEAPKPPELIDSRGRPLVRADLTREIGGPSVTGVRSIMSGHPAQGLTPERLAVLLRSAENGDAVGYLELAEEMEEKHLHYQAVLGVRKRAITQLPISVESASDDPQDEADAQLVRDWIERDTLHEELFDILDAIGKGFSATEMIWDTSDNPWLIQELVTQDPRFFEFDRVDGKTLMLKGDGGVPEPLSPLKFIVHFHKAKSGVPIRGGLARSVAWAYLFTNYGIKDWIVFLETYGMPLRVGKYDNGTAESDIRVLEQAIAQLGSDAGAIIPKSMLIEFIEGGGGASSAEMFKKLCDYFDQQISKAVLGQTSSTDALAGGLGSGQATSHDSVREDIQNADARQLAASLNRQLVRPLIDLNRGKRKNYPRIVIGKPEVADVKSYLETVEKAVSFGIEVGESGFRKATGLAEPKPGEKLLKAPAQNPSALPDEEGAGGLEAKTEKPAVLGRLKTALSGKAKAEEDPITAAALIAPPKRDQVDDLADEHLGDWQRMLDPAVAAIEQALDGAATPEEAVAALARLADTIDVSTLHTALAHSMFTARLAGDADIQRAQRE